MHISIGLPATVSGVQGSHLLDWARKVDAGPFLSLGIIDRLVYANFDPLITLAAVAAVTQRVRLMTTILIVPLHNTGVLTKQIASLDNLSGGRLTLGVGVGGREDDFVAAPAIFRGRGRHFEKQLDVMQRLWSGQEFDVEKSIGAIGPQVVQSGGPELLIGGNTPVALQRVQHWGNGVILGGNPDQARGWFNIADAAWHDSGRPGKPRFVGGMYYALGPQAFERGGAYLRQFYAYTTGRVAEQIASKVASTPGQVQTAIQSYADVGVDELILWPCIADIEQVDRLADLIR